VRPTPSIPAAVGAALLTLCALPACSSSGPASGCGPIRHEALDPHFLIHVLGDAKVEYTSDPPTSGPHQPTPPVAGVRPSAIPKPQQVGLLEGGAVLVQYRPDLSTADRRQVEALAGDRIVIAPDPDLHDAVVATAWVYKRSCGSVDTAALQEFIHARRGKGPGTTVAP
jgi:hypothetical protein